MSTSTKTELEAKKAASNLGKTTLRKHGKKFYKKISNNYWNSPAGMRRRSVKI